MIRIGILIATAVVAILASQCRGAHVTLLNASFDIARELFSQYNPVFAEHWKKQTGETVVINQSHGGSSKQARAVIDGLEADVVSMNQVIDIDAIAERGHLPKDWRGKLPHNSSPFSSAIVFLVRKGNPKRIKDWDDLAKAGVSVVVPNPKTSGNGRYSYLSAYAYAKRKGNGDEQAAYDFVRRLFKNVPVLDTGGRGATTSFVERQIGDVLLTFEAEVLLTIKEAGADKFDVVTPSLSVEAEMPVAVVERFARKHKTEALARAYLDYLYSEKAQDLIARNFYRPRLQAAFEKHREHFGNLALVTVDDAFGGWAAAQKTHFTDGGLFDRLQRDNRTK